MRNQKGEIVPGIIVVMMAVMMIFSGMAWMHGNHGSGGHCMQNEQKDDHHEAGMRQNQNGGYQPAAPQEQNR